MARKSKTIDVQKFGGVEHLGEVATDVTESPIDDVTGHTLDSIETSSDTKLEDDHGTGRAVVMRTFTFKANQKAFKDHLPLKQELFNMHYRGIEMYLWKDGLLLCQEYEPHLLFNSKKTHYTIFVVATPSHSNVLSETPKTLSEISNG